MPRTLIAALAAVTFIVGLIAGGTRAGANHWAGSVTNVLDNDVQTQGCHDNPYYFNPIYGWARSCNGAHDIANGGSSPQVYIRGYFWNSAKVTAAQGNPVYYDQGCSSLAGYEYNNAFEIIVPTGTIGIAFHHMNNYHYGVGTTVQIGTHVGEQASWGGWVYYCSGSLASTGPHIHTEAARDGVPDDSQLVDTWMFGCGAPGCPFISYRHP